MLPYFFCFVKHLNLLFGNFAYAIFILFVGQEAAHNWLL